MLLRSAPATLRARVRLDYSVTADWPTIRRVCLNSASQPTVLDVSASGPTSANVDIHAINEDKLKL
eukprot:11190832-Lingulodinium_polyedra.AAC.1